MPTLPKHRAIVGMVRSDNPIVLFQTLLSSSYSYCISCTYTFAHFRRNSSERIVNRFGSYLCVNERECVGGIGSETPHRHKWCSETDLYGEYKRRRWHISHGSILFTVRIIILSWSIL